MPTVSYVVTVYNKRPYLPYLLAGLAAQRGTFERQFIFVDDGSTDGSGDHLRDLTRHWPGVSVISQHNQGPARALNRGLAEVTGDFIKPMDADDVLLPESTDVLLSALNTSGLAFAFGDQGRYRTDLAGGPEAVLLGAKPPTGPVQTISDALHRILRRSLSTPSAWLATTEVVRTAGGSDPDVFVQDYSVELRIARLTGFAHVAAPVFLAPDDAPGRMSHQVAQTLHDVNLAVCHLLRDHPDLPARERRYGVHRVLSRALRWRRREEPGAAVLSAEFRTYLAALAGWPPGEAETLVEAACATFRRTHAIRLPAAEARASRTP